MMEVQNCLTARDVLRTSIVSPSPQEPAGPLVSFSPLLGQARWFPLILRGRPIGSSSRVGRLPIIHILGVDIFPEYGQV